MSTVYLCTGKSFFKWHGIPEEKAEFDKKKSAAEVAIARPCEPVPGIKMVSFSGKTTFNCYSAEQKQKGATNVETDQQEIIIHSWP